MYTRAIACVMGLYTSILGLAEISKRNSNNYWKMRLEVSGLEVNKFRSEWIWK